MAAAATRAVLVVLILSLVAPLAAQAWTGQDSGTPIAYYAKDSSAPDYATSFAFDNNWASISIAYQGTALSFPVNGYNNGGPIDLGMNFNLFGQSCPQILVNAAGFITCDTAATANPDSTAMASAPNKIIAPFWARDQGGNPTLSAGCGGRVDYRTETVPGRGTASNGKVFVLQFESVPLTAGESTPSGATCGSTVPYGGFVGGSGYVYFQIRLYEKSDLIEFHYYSAPNYVYVCGVVVCANKYVTVNAGIHGGSSQYVQYGPATAASGGYVYVGSQTVQFRPSSPSDATAKAPLAVDDSYVYDYTANGGAAGPGLTTQTPPRIVQYIFTNSGSTTVTAYQYYPGFVPCDVGKVLAATGVPSGAKITSYSTDGGSPWPITSVVISAAATSTQSYVQATVGTISNALVANDRPVGAAPIITGFVTGSAAGPGSFTLTRCDGTGTSPTISSDGTFIFKPTGANPCGDYSFSYTARDAWTVNNPAAFAPTTATVRIKVTNCATPPVVNPASLTTPQNTALPITLTGSAPSGNPLTFSVVTGPSYGTLQLPFTSTGATSATTKYTPTTGYCSATPDSFTVKANDGVSSSAPATIKITVVCPGPSNQAPVALPVTYNLFLGSGSLSTLSRGAAYSLLATASDPDAADTVTVAQCAGPAVGTLGSGIDAFGNFGYAPVGTTAYTTSFTYKAVDNHGVASPCVTVTLKVLPHPDFTASTFTPQPGQLVSYSDIINYTLTPVSQTWDFGDAATGSGLQPQHAFANPGSYVVRLKVTDNRGAFGWMNKTLTATATQASAPGDAPRPQSSPAPAPSAAPTPAPVADAGLDIRTTGGATVALHGLANGGKDGFFSWIQVAGPTVSLKDADTPDPTFVAPQADARDTLLLSFRLTVSDGARTSQPAEVAVAIEPRPMAAPVVVAVSPATQEGQLIRLGAEGGPGTTYLWTQMTGPAVEFDNARSPTPSFLAPPGSAGERLTFKVNVTDGHSFSTAFVQVVVSGAKASAAAPSTVAEVQVPQRSRPVARVHSTPGLAIVPVLAALLIAVGGRVRRKSD